MQPAVWWVDAPLKADLEPLRDLQGPDWHLQYFDVDFGTLVLEHAPILVAGIAVVSILATGPLAIAFVWPLRE